MDRQPFLGFSLIELLVVMGIFTVISSLILANHSRFNSSVLLNSLAYDMALSVRQAQVYGLSVRGSASGFQVGYGIHVTQGTSYVFFTDVNGNKRYDAGTDAIVQTYTVGQGYQVSRFCGVKSDGASECSNASSPISSLDIVFFRPNPDAVMYSDVGGPYSSGTVTVASGAQTRTIVVASTGQISVQNP